MMINKLFVFTFTAIALIALAPSLVFAHVVVKPAEVGLGAFQTFTVGVPNERDNPTIEVRLVLPEGLGHVSPNVKPGWEISTKHAEGAAEQEHEAAEEGDHADAPIAEISWTGGAIPAGQRDDFMFSAQVPATEGELIWKAYQTYSDGTVVSWELDPAQQGEGQDLSESGPFSKTTVIDDLGTNSAVGSENNPNLGESNMPTILSIAALLISLAAVSLQFYKKR